jgi:hypothetical protein
LVATTNINITYRCPIKPSIKGISIYQYFDNGNLPTLRQFIPMESLWVTISPDKKTINVKILESTLNQPKSTFYIVVDDDAVKYYSSNQGLLGISKNHWNFKTSDKKYIFADEIVGRLSLTKEGAKYFNNLSSYHQNEFLSSLKIHLAEIIPINIDRLSDIKYYENEDGQIFLLLTIKSIKDLNKQNVKSIINDLNQLVQHKKMTLISWNITDVLDSNFGFKIMTGKIIIIYFIYYF